MLQQKYIQKNKKQILFAFLDAKDKNGQDIIQSQSLEQLIATVNPKEKKEIYHILSEYKKKNPEDKRFSNLKSLTPMKDRLTKLSGHSKNQKEKISSSHRDKNTQNRSKEKE